MLAQPFLGLVQVRKARNPQVQVLGQGSVGGEAPRHKRPMTQRRRHPFPDLAPVFQRQVFDSHVVSSVYTLSFGFFRTIGLASTMGLATTGARTSSDGSTGGATAGAAGAAGAETGGGAGAAVSTTGNT